MFSLLHFKNIAAHLPPHTIYCHLLVTSTTKHLKLPAPSGCIKLELYSCIKTERHDTFALVPFLVSTNMIEIKSFCNFCNPNVFKPWVQLLFPSLPQGSGCLGLGLDFHAAVWPQVTAVWKELCEKAPWELGPALACFALVFSWATCPSSRPSYAAVVLVPLCYKLAWCSELPADTRPALLTLNRWGDCGDWAWQSCHHPCLPAHLAL